MQSQQYISLLYGLLIVFILLNGCARTGSGSEDESLESDLEDESLESDLVDGGIEFSSEDSDLVLVIPSGLSVSLNDVRTIYEAVDANSACKSSTSVDLILAQACNYYHQIYLYQDRLPTTLEAIKTLNSYVKLLQITDPYTFHFTPQQFTELNSSIEGTRSTIGFSYSLASNVISATSPFEITAITPLSRAWFDGLEAGDHIIAINGELLEGLDQDTVLSKLPTAEEEAVTLTVSRNGAEITIQTASEEHIGFFVGEENDIAYLRVKQYATTTGDELKEDFETLGNLKTINKMILDLRGNGGGSVSGTLAMVDFLIDKDTPQSSNAILITESKILDSAFYLGDYNTTNAGNFSKDNFVVLIDNTSASASEITAAALRDYETVTLIGTTSFGKGVSQSVVDLIDGSGLLITSQNLLSPLGKSWHFSGVEPDFAISTSPTSPTNDPQLDAAIDFLNTGSLTSNLLVAPGSSKRTTAPTLDPWIQLLKSKKKEV